MVGVFILILIPSVILPGYKYLMDIRNSHVCTQNLLDISTALEGYVTDNDDRFPPAYMTADDGVGPRILSGNAVFSWASIISEYMKKQSSFKCPAAGPGEGVATQPSNGGPVFESDYGMYAAFSGAERGSIAQLSSAALVADSDNGGANGTFDPNPLKDSKGRVTPDGMVIGLDTTNLTDEDRTQTRIDAAKYATRLALPNSARAGFGNSTLTRHPDGINVLMADLHREHLKGDAAIVEHPGKKGSGVIGLWYVPPAP